MNPASTTIPERSLFGYVVRLFYGAAAVMLLFGFLWFVQHEQGSVPGSALPIVLLYLVLVALLTLASMYLYSLSYVQLDDTGVTVHSWATLFADTSASTPWYRITNVDSVQRGIVAELVGYGTLLVQQAGTAQPVRLTYIPRVDYWADLIQQRANATPQPVKEQV